MSQNPNGPGLFLPLSGAIECPGVPLGSVQVLPRGSSGGLKALAVNIIAPFGHLIALFNHRGSCNGVPF